VGIQTGKTGRERGEGWAKGAVLLGPPYEGQNQREGTLYPSDVHRSPHLEDEGDAAPKVSRSLAMLPGITAHGGEAEFSHLS